MTKKLVVVAAVLMLMLVAAVPAFAGNRAVGGDVKVRVTNCSQLQAAAARQEQRGNARSRARGIGSASAAKIHQKGHITQKQLNACRGRVHHR